MRILCCGSKDFTNSLLIAEEFVYFPEGSVIIHGNAPGADSMCDEAARYLGFKVKVYDAQWEVVGSKRAGLYRNTQMLWEAKPDRVVAFRSKRNSPGTNDMIYKATRKGIPVKIIDDF